MAENTKLSITRSFFELETTDFAQKFVWTVRTKYKCKKVQKYKVLINKPFFELQIQHGSSYGLSDEITKYKKYKSLKSALRTKK